MPTASNCPGFEGSCLASCFDSIEALDSRRVESRVNLAGPGGNKSETSETPMPKPRFT